jgi:hypothetical protein
MNLRLLPWFLFAAVVAWLAFRAPLPGEGAKAPAVARGTAVSVLEIRLAPVEMLESHDDGAWNRFSADEAVYSYGRKTVRGSGVVVSLGAGERIKGAVIRAPSAFWDFDGKSISLPDGGNADRGKEWKGTLSPAALDLGGRILRVPGEASLSGPGFSVAGRNLEWSLTDGKITMDSPASSIAPARLPGRRG